MSQLLGVLAPFGLGAGKGVSHNDDSFTDRISHSYTVLVFVVFCLVVSTKQYVGDPIQCWVPGHFTSTYVDYTAKACWVSNTYYLPFKQEEIPKEGEHKAMINYYQWVPMLLLFQAVLFYAPCLIWRATNRKIGIQINNIVEAGNKLHDGENKEKNMLYMVRQFDRYLGHYRDDTRGCCARLKVFLAQRMRVLCGMKYGNFLTLLYILIKFLYFVNAIGQLFIMDGFLGTDFHFYGIRVLKSLASDEVWPGTARFPTFTMCDFKVRQLGNIQRHTVQCVLPINFFNEKLYIGLWFWLAIVAAVTSTDMVIWLGRCFLRQNRLRFVRRHLRNMGVMRRPQDRATSSKFVTDYLRQDGVLMLRLVASNTSDLVTSELTAELYDHYQNNPPTCLKKRQEDKDDYENAEDHV